MSKLLKILINSRTSGKFKRETIDGRSHIVTTMMPIRGDITMNSIFYSDKEVANSFMQLDMLPAPNKHPTVNGVSVPAFHPVANNKHNIGAFLRNPRKKGKRVFVDLLIDEEIANNTEDGKETMRRVEANEKIGASTGLTINQVFNKTGTDDFGKKFTKEGKGFNFDHVAILLNEHAAGEHAGTEIVLNEEDYEVLVHNAEWKINELSTSDLHQGLGELIKPSADHSFSWVIDIKPESKVVFFAIELSNSPKTIFKQSYAIDQNDNITLLNDRVEVIENPEKFITKQTTTNQEVDEMDKSKLVLAIIGNNANKFTVADNDRLTAMSDDKLLAIVASNVDEDGAKTILTNAGFDFKSYESFVANKADFNLYQKDKAEVSKGVITNIVENSDYTEDMLKGKSAEELDLINNMLTPEKVAKRLGEQHQNIHTNAAKDAVVDYS